MAYDPEARETGNSAMIIGIVALTLVVGGALAYFLTRSSTPDEVNTSTTIVRDRPVPGNNTVVVTPPTVIERNVPVPVPAPQTRTIIRDKSTTTNTTRVVPAPQTGGNSSPMGAQQPNVTINNNAPNNSGSAGASGADAPASDAGAAADNSAGSADSLPAPAQQ